MTRRAGGAKVDSRLRERLSPEVRAALPEDLGIRRDRVGFDLRRELEHFTRNLSLDERQRRLVRAQFEHNNAALARHAAERRAHRDKTLALHQRLKRLNAALDRRLKRMAREEAGGWRKVRGLLKPGQKKVFDMLMAERRRIETMWIEMCEAEAKGKPPAMGPV